MADIKAIAEELVNLTVKEVQEWRGCCCRGEVFIRRCSEGGWCC